MNQSSREKFLNVSLFGEDEPVLKTLSDDEVCHQDSFFNYKKNSATIGQANRTRLMPLSKGTGRNNKIITKYGMK